MIRLNKILVIDLESTCWEGKNPPEGESSEIIEIGVAVYDRTLGKPIAMKSFPVRPERSRVTSYCTELTGWTWEALRHAPPLVGALSQLTAEFGPKNKLWASWGEGDRVFLETECRRLGLKYPFAHRHMNIKTLYALVRGLKAEVGLAKALVLEGIEPHGEAHRGDWDAWNTARLLPGLIPITNSLQESN